MRLKITVSDRDYQVTVSEDNGFYLVDCEGHKLPMEVVSRDSNLIKVKIGEQLHQFGKLEKDGVSWSHFQGMNLPTTITESRFSRITRTLTPRTVRFSTNHPPPADGRTTRPDPVR